MAWAPGWGYGWWRRGGWGKWGWSGPWPGRGPWSHLPPWERPGWIYGPGYCWRVYGVPGWLLRGYYPYYPPLYTTPWYSYYPPYPWPLTYTWWRPGWW